jgi:hypothetical protein
MFFKKMKDSHFLNAFANDTELMVLNHYSKVKLTILLLNSRLDEKY